MIEGPYNYKKVVIASWLFARTQYNIMFDNTIIRVVSGVNESTIKDIVRLLNVAYNEGLKDQYLYQYFQLLVKD